MSREVDDGQAPTVYQTALSSASAAPVDKHIRLLAPGRCATIRPVSFWHHIPQPIIGLSPMDGVTDPAFRFIVARYGKPDVQVTEFVNVDEVCHGGDSAWQQLQYAEIERPVVAQIYGADPDKFYQVAQVVCELGFDGVDINMGCPSKNVSARGCGAALIRNQPLAREIIRAVHAGVTDWAAGHRIESIDRKSTRLNSSHGYISYAVFCLKKKKKRQM